MNWTKPIVHKPDIMFLVWYSGQGVGFLTVKLWVQDKLLHQLLLSSDKTMGKIQVTSDSSFRVYVIQFWKFNLIKIIIVKKVEDEMALSHEAYPEVHDSLKGTLWTVYNVETPTSAISPHPPPYLNLWEIFILLKSRIFLTSHAQIWLGGGTNCREVCESKQNVVGHDKRSISDSTIPIMPQWTPDSSS